MNQEAYVRLEFYKIINLIRKWIKSSQGLEALDGIKPINTELIRKEMNLTREMTEYLRFDGSLSFYETGPIAELLKNSLIAGYSLGIEDLYEIKKTIELWVSNKNSLVPYFIKYKEIEKLVSQIRIPDALVKKLNKIMDSDGSILDSASDDLKKIRKRKTSIRGDIQVRLNTIMDGNRLGDALQERIVTIRDGRFVIPVRTQFKNKLKQEMQYIVHSFSGSGETAYVEPQDIVHLNNEIVEIDELEWEEIRRILRDVTVEIRQEFVIISELSTALGNLELIYAKAKFAMEFHCGFPIPDQDGCFLELKNARHPLLGEKCIPIDIEVGKSCQGIIISGPNAGGKTAALKTAGLLTLMTLSGLPVTADSESKVGVFDEILVEIGDEQNLSENLSSFSGHILSISNILKICNSANTKCLVLIDEIASSTEPKEGEALGREIAQAVLDSGALFIITTHFQGLKELAYSNNCIKNAFVEFDEEHLVPLYRLCVGGSGQSYALRVAKKYGLPEKIITGADNYLKAHASDMDMLLKSVEEERGILFRKKNIVEKQISESRKIRDKYLLLLKETQDRKNEIEQKGIATLKSGLDDAIYEISKIREDLKRNRVKNIKEAEATVSEIRKTLDEKENEMIREKRKKLIEWKPGQKVFVSAFKKEGIIEEVNGDRARVRIGILSTISKLSDLYQSENDIKDDLENRIQLSTPPSPMVHTIDIRGMTAEEALRALEKAMDSSLIGGASQISIIHGKGEGVLRKAVWNYLKTNRNVKKFVFAKPDDGGQGKTIVVFK